MRNFLVILESQAVPAMEVVCASDFDDQAVRDYISIEVELYGFSPGDIHSIVEIPSLTSRSVAEPDQDADNSPPFYRMDR